MASGALQPTGAVRGVLVVGTGRIASIGLQFVATWFTLRLLPVEAAGGYLLAFSICLTLQLIAQIGLGAAAVPGIGRLRALGDLPAARGTALVSVALAAGAGAIAALILAMGGAARLAELLRSSYLAQPLAIMAWSVPCMSFSWVCVEIMRAFDKQGLGTLLAGVIANGSQVVCLCWFMLRGSVAFDAGTAGGVFVVGAAVNALVAACFLALALPGSGCRLNTPLGALLRGARPLWLYSLLILCIAQMDVWLAASLLDDRNTGIYTIASRWMSFLTMPHQVLAAALVPRLVQAFHGTNPEAVEPQLRRNAGYGTIASVIGFAGILIASPWLFHTAHPTPGLATEGALIAAGLGLGHLTAPLFGNALIYLIIADRRWIAAIISLGAVPVIAAGAAIGAVVGNAYGLACGMTAGLLCYRAFASRFVLSRFHVRTWPACTWRSLIPLHPKRSP